MHKQTKRDAFGNDEFTLNLAKDLAKLSVICHSCGCITSQNYKIKEMSTRNGKYLCESCNNIEEQMSKNMNRLSI